MKSFRQKKYRYLLPLLFLISLAFPRLADSQNGERKIVQLAVKGKKILAELARTEEEKSRGLMFRETLGPDEGMLFVYPREDFLAFWMKNTPLPLSIAFLDSRGRIVDIQDMQPFSLRTHTSSRPARYALEMNKGWFQKNAIRVGDVVNIPPLPEK